MVKLQLLNTFQPFAKIFKIVVPLVCVTKTVSMDVATLELARTVVMMFLAQLRKQSPVILVPLKLKNNDLLTTLTPITNVHVLKISANVSQNLNAKFKLVQVTTLQLTNSTYADAAKS
jgi:hypothetical protein